MGSETSVGKRRQQLRIQKVVTFTFCGRVAAFPACAVVVALALALVLAAAAACALVFFSGWCCCCFGCWCATVALGIAALLAVAALADDAFIHGPRHSTCVQVFGCSNLRLETRFTTDLDLGWSTIKSANHQVQLKWMLGYVHPRKGRGRGQEKKTGEEKEKERELRSEREEKEGKRERKRNPIFFMLKLFGVKEYQKMFRNEIRNHFHPHGTRHRI